MPHSNSFSEPIENKCCNKFTPVEHESGVHRLKMLEKEGIREYRRKLYNKFKNNITIHGYRQLSTEKGWRKIMWAVVMTLLTTFAVYLSYHMLLDFGYQTVLEYENEDGDAHLNYPTITICTNSPVYSEKAYNNFPVNITLQEFKDFYKEILSSVGFLYNTTNSSRTILKALYQINITSYVIHIMYPMQLS